MVVDVGDLGGARTGLGLRLPSPVVRLQDDDMLDQRGVAIYLKRDDLIHTELPGNKWRKLKYNLAAAREQGASTLLTFGGAYSNHIRAVAAAADHFGFRSIGVIRGERHDPLNDVLAFAQERGMILAYMDRQTYRRKMSAEVVDRLHSELGEFFLIPEGGSNAHAVRGCAELVDEIDQDFDFICCPCGSGGTLAGIASRFSKATNGNVSF
jgi:1-aminocyclopropane-1-carboxylate deaminase